MLVPMIAILAFAAIKIARIMADRPAGSSPDLTDRVAELEREVQGVQQQLAETQERLDFAERLLAKGGSQ
jgi:DNA-binding transcriptional MerR regulator